MKRKTPVIVPLDITAADMADHAIQCMRMALHFMLLTLECDGVGQDQANTISIAANQLDLARAHVAGVRADAEALERKKLAKPKREPRRQARTVTGR